MSQDPGLGDFRVLAWRPGQADDAFQALKRHFDAPPGTVEFAGFAAGEGFCLEGSDKNDPSGGFQRAAGDGIAFLLRSLPRFGA